MVITDSLADSLAHFQEDWESFPTGRQPNTGGHSNTPVKTPPVNPMVCGHMPYHLNSQASKPKKHQQRKQSTTSAAPNTKTTTKPGLKC